MNAVMLIPGEVPLASWRDILRGAGVRLDPSHVAPVAAGAAAVERILARGEPVYGLNTGFGKLASVRIAAEDLATLQRNIVLSHAAGVGEATPAPVVRLMMALPSRRASRDCGLARWRIWRRCSPAISCR